MVNKYEPEAIDHRKLVAYTNQLRDRQKFVVDLKEIRKKEEKQTVKEIKKEIGPQWYQSLSVLQRRALDVLDFSIYQDILEGRPVRTSTIMKQLGLYPRPSNVDLMTCVYLGRDDGKQMLAQLFQIIYGHDFDIKRMEYPLNAKLILSAILYLGLNDLLKLLKKRFEPDKEPEKIESKPKLEPQTPLESPYLQKNTAVVFVPHKAKPFQPAPLPNLDELNEPYEEEAPSKPLPSTNKGNTLPSSPKKRPGEARCDKLVGLMNIEPYSSVTNMPVEDSTRTTSKKKGKSKMPMNEVQLFGAGTSFGRKKRIKKPIAPSTGIQNAQYTIRGVYTINGRSFYEIGSVSIMPLEGEMIHGGFKYFGNDVVNVHCGIRGRSPAPVSNTCDCIQKWHDIVFDYVKRNKCHCGHYYDYGNEGTFPPFELPYFEKPSKGMPFQFNYDTIYDLDQKHLLVRKKFKNFWETDSVLHIGDPSGIKSEKRKKKVKRSSTTCLGENPTPEDYLTCSLRHMRRLNIAAKLPDVHLVPELKEWMRRRIYGPFSNKEKKEMLRKSIVYWTTLLRLMRRGYGHVSPPKDPRLHVHTTWANKQKLVDMFRKYTQQYKLSLYRSYANITNMLWPTMCQAQFPDKSFREIYFSYMFSRIEDVLLMHPYSSQETIERLTIINKRRYRCPLSIDGP